MDTIITTFETAIGSTEFSDEIVKMGFQLPAFSAGYAVQASGGFHYFRVSSTVQAVFNGSLGDWEDFTSDTAVQDALEEASGNATFSLDAWMAYEDDGTLAGAYATATIVLGADEIPITPEETITGTLTGNFEARLSRTDLGSVPDPVAPPANQPTRPGFGAPGFELLPLIGALLGLATLPILQSKRRKS